MIHTALAQWLIEELGRERHGSIEAVVDIRLLRRQLGRRLRVAQRFGREAT
jgi:hypothetical protein